MRLWLLALVACGAPYMPAPQEPSAQPAVLEEPGEPGEPGGEEPGSPDPDRATEEPGEDAPSSRRGPHVAKIMYWSGKVNQHYDLASGRWETDPDGSSGADLDRLGYCRKWYRTTSAVRELAPETISTWRAAGNSGAFTSSQPAYECVQDRPAARVMFWSGKVNQHFDVASGTWKTDPDGTSGADVDPLDYCRKWYPSTVSVSERGNVTIKTWRAAGNTGAYTSTQPAYECVQGAPRIMYWSGKVNQHFDLKSGTWKSDPDGSSGADIDKLEYCRKWYPSAVAVRQGERVKLKTWRAAGNSGAYTSTQPTFDCVLD